MSEQEQWAVNQIWPSLDAINDTLKCPRPHAGAGGCHWWYNLNEDDEDAFLIGEAFAETVSEREASQQNSCDHVQIVCKTCSLVLKLSTNAPEFPAI